MSAEFVKFRDVVHNNLNEMFKNNKRLYVLNVNKDAMYQKYLASFPVGTNDIYRKRTVHDCSTCHHFIKNAGAVIAINEDLSVVTIWDNWNDMPDPYMTVAKKMARWIRTNLGSIKGVYLETLKRLGQISNIDAIDPAIKYDHLYAEVPNEFIDDNKDSTLASISGDYQVLKSGLQNFTKEALDVVIDLINQDSLYRGDQHKAAVVKFREFKEIYDKIEDEIPRKLYCWRLVGNNHASVTRLKNTSIGTLIMDISEGKELDAAVDAYEKMVAPENYQRSKPIFTKKMVEDAKAKIEELGLTSSLQRRFANEGDINVNDILFINRDNSKTEEVSASDDPFSALDGMAKSNKPNFSKVEEVPINKFIDEVLPTAKKVEAYFDGRLTSNLMSLTTSTDPKSPSMFKWDNPFAWAYKGNVTDGIKENVAKAGGNVTGDLRFSIQWNEYGDDHNDLDAHCIEPSEFEICFYNKNSNYTKGHLDIDIRNPAIEINNRVAVENIFWQSRRTMQDGTYKFFVHNYDHRGGTKGFRAEIEFDGQIYTFNYDREIRYNQSIEVAYVTLKNGQFTIEPKLDSSMQSKEVWGVKTNEFIPVSMITMSPNYWGDNNVGNKHYFFMIKGLINDEEPNGFYNEYLKEDLRQYRKVFEALGSQLHVKSTDDQLSGIGFSSTLRNNIVLRVTSSMTRLIKVTF